MNADDDASVPVWQVDNSQYEQLLHHLTLPVAVNTVDGDLRAVNPAFTALLGYTDADAIGMTVRQIVHPHSHPAVGAAVQRLASGDVRAQSGIRKLVRKNGTVMWAQVHLTTFTHNGELMTMAFVEDWSERHWNNPAAVAALADADTAATGEFDDNSVDEPPDELAGLAGVAVQRYPASTGGGWALRSV
ncbi:hypothetical protein GCM10027169_16850 [Gordonia jinhuaensis]|uniref:PAS domain-containing protein n=1 Tax=Gordonia jinhuaensis TaxID=1517702 RepID=A0A916TLW1_9ACTN|nr:PAS domain S-box protein [Gordonia jinhuaensis]GGB47882.1 hypothetical protein GCM10011489_38850 [Gordonia jinhuaensis]